MTQWEKQPKFTRNLKKLLGTVRHSVEESHKIPHTVEKSPEFITHGKINRNSLHSGRRSRKYLAQWKKIIVVDSIMIIWREIPVEQVKKGRETPVSVRKQGNCQRPGKTRVKVTRVLKYIDQAMKIAIMDRKTQLSR